MNSTTPNPTRLFRFVGALYGSYRIIHTETPKGDPLPYAACLSMLAASAPSLPKDAVFVLGGITSNERYVNRSEKNELVRVQEGLGRPNSTHAAFVPIKKNAAWWALTQDERRAIFEETSHHTKIGLKYLPAIARRLHHCRDLSESEQFDFLTWFEFAPEDESLFTELLCELRETYEWTYVEREVEFRLVLA